MIRVLCIFALLLGAFGPSTARAETSIFDVRSGIVQFLLRSVSTPGSFEITADVVDTNEIGATRLNGVKVADAAGVWIEIESVAINWSPQRLLVGEVEIDALDVQGMTVLRPPAPGSEAPQLENAPQFSFTEWPRAPINIVIDQFNLQGVDIREGVLARPIAFDARGRFEDSGDVQAASLQLSRTDAVSGEIDLSYVRQFDTRDLSLDLVASEEAGGLVAAYASLPDTSASALQLRGSGPPQAFVGTLEATAEESFSAQGNLSLNLDQPFAVSANMLIETGPGLAPGARAVLGSQAALAVRARENAAGLIEVQDGFLLSESLSVNARGTVDRGNEVFDLNLSADATADFARVLPNITFDAARFVGSVKGDFISASANGTLSLEGVDAFSVQANQTDLNLVAQRTGETTGRLGFDGSAAGAVVQGVVVGDTTMALGAEVDGQIADLNLLRLDSSVLRVDGRGRYDFADAAGTLDARINAPDLAPFGDRFETAVSGRADFTLTAGVEGGETTAQLSGVAQGFASELLDMELANFDADLTTSPDSLSLIFDADASDMRLDALGPDILPQAAIGVTLERSVEGGDRLRVRRGVLTSPVMTLDVSGTLGGAAGNDLIYVAEIADLSPIARAYEREISGAAYAEGRLQTSTEGVPTLEGFAQFQTLALGDEALGTLTLDHGVTFDEGAAGSIILSGDGGFFDGAFFSTGFVVSDGAFAVEGFDGELLDLQMQANLSGTLPSGDAAPTITGAIEILDGNLASFGQRVDPALGLRGGIAGQMAFSHAPDAGQLIELSGTLDALTITEVFLQEGRIDLRVADAFGDADVLLDAALTTLSLTDGTIIDTAMLTATGPIADVSFEIDTAGDVSTRPFSAMIEGEAQGFGEPSQQITLRRVDAQIVGESLRLSAPVTLRRDAEAIELFSSELLVGESSAIAAEGRLTAEGLAGELNFRAIDVVLIERLGFGGFQDGEVSGEVFFNTDPDTPFALLSASVRDLRMENVPERVDPILMDIGGQWDGETLLMELEAYGPVTVPAEATIALPMRPRRLNPIPEIPTDEPFAASLVWQGDLGDIFSVLPGQDQLLSGATAFDLNASGTLASPVLNGTVSLEDGRYEHFRNGVILTDVTVQSEIIDLSTLQLTLVGSDGGRGRVGADLTVEFTDAGALVSGGLTAERAVMVRRDDVTAMISADLTLSGQMGALLLSGPIIVDRAEARLVNATAPRIPTLGEIRITGQPLIIQDAVQPSTMELDLQVLADGDVFLRGRGLDSEWSMDLTVGGTSRTAEISGAMQRERGTFTLIGRIFDITRGSVVFDGTFPPNPALDVAMERVEDDLTGFIVISGRGNNPQITIRSDPVLPEEEVLPRLLFDQSQQTLSPGQTLALASGLTTLLTGQDGPLDIARNALGVDVLQIDPDQDGEAAVTVGRSLTDEVFLSAEQRLSGEEQSTVRVEIDVLDNVVLDGAVSDTGSNSVGVTFSRDF
ncbi:MAG: translocation/assembly module TamB domain-containing protein [Pseudomonadota bacterium]